MVLLKKTAAYIKNDHFYYNTGKYQNQSLTSLVADRNKLHWYPLGKISKMNSL